METKKKKRPVVGIMTGSFHTENSHHIVDTICRFLSEADVDIRLYQGMDATRFLNNRAYVDKDFDYHYYSLFGYSRFDAPDYLILSFGTISAVENPMSLEEFVAFIPDVPKVLLETEEDVPGCIYVIVDNYTGMRSAVEHLLDVHGITDIVFVSGPQGVGDAEIRLQAYRDVMEERGLPSGEDRVIPGDFTDLIDPLIEDYVKRNGMPRAFACANDDMAESVYRVIRSYGLVPGTDVAVTGFDSIISSEHMEPPLTTIQQDFELVTEISAQKVVSLIKKEKAFISEKIPAKLIVRGSCGCKYHKPKKKTASTEQMLLDTRSNFKSLQLDNIMSTLINRHLLNDDITMEGFFTELGRQIAVLGTGRSYICLLESPEVLSENDRGFLPDHLKLHMLQEKENVFAYGKEDAPVLRYGDAATLFSGEENTRMASFLLFYGKYHYGILCAEIDVKDMLFYYTLSLEIGNALRFLYLALAQQETLASLSRTNRILDFTASHDALTGCYNRVGFTEQGPAFLKEYPDGDHFLAVMGDLDHLKQINDTYGHDAGDSAIRTAAVILQGAMPLGSPICRSGGDEFMCLFHCDTDVDAAIAEFKKGVKEACADYNSTSGKPYYVEVAVGCFGFSTDGEFDYKDIFKEADNRLYEAKQHRRASIVKEV